MPVGAILSGVGGVVGALGGGGGTQQQRFLDPQQAALIAARKDRFTGGTADLNRRSIEAANQAQASFNIAGR